MQTGESWDMVLHAKSRGAHNLHKASLQCKELDHFVMWSSFVASAGNEGKLPRPLFHDAALTRSASSTTSAPCLRLSIQCTASPQCRRWGCWAAGQTNYGFANGVLDILAEQRRAMGLPALCIQWGVIDHVGVADKGIQVLSQLLCALLPTDFASLHTSHTPRLICGLLLPLIPQGRALRSCSWLSHLA